MASDVDVRTSDLFADAPNRPGALGCAIEIAASIGEALERVRKERGMTREQVAERMSFHLGEKLSENMLNNYVSQAHGQHEISLRRAMALDAALEGTPQCDTLLRLYARKRGERAVINQDDAALLEWARLHHQERELAERRKVLEAALKVRGMK
ncbi:MAG: helix-turn-helix transcriptional regulator [Pseudomonadota bacterium]|nr:helix-turn-helix transcriptional regulator [Pseudomonadota bacterium]